MEVGDTHLLIHVSNHIEDFGGKTHLHFLFPSPHIFTTPLAGMCNSTWYRNYNVYLLGFCWHSKDEHCFQSLFDQSAQSTLQLVDTIPTQIKHRV